MKADLRLKYLVLVLGTILFNYLFWKESHGINILIYNAFMLMSVLLLGYKPKKKIESIAFLAATILTSLAIAWHGALFAIVMYYISFAFFVGLLQENKLKSIVFVIAAVFSSIVKLPSKLFGSLPLGKRNKQKFKQVSKIIKLSLIPIVILLVFYSIYINANPVFENYAAKLLSKIEQALANFFETISFVRVLFIALALFVTAWFLFKTNLEFLYKKESLKNQKLIRKRVKRHFPNPDYVRNLKDNMPVLYRRRFALSLKLKNEYISALVLLLLVNILLLIVNIIDIKWVWFGFEYSPEFDLKQFVHEGTYLLIISILLSIGIMLYFFRNNLNFYQKSKTIKNLSYIWIIQNSILAISVAIRNLHYITYWGLAYKRIGVILFLIAVGYGLYSLYIKIRHTKTAYFLIRKNTMAVFAILVTASLLNWDRIISTHNLNHPIKENMETSYLLTMSDKALPLIDQKQEILNQMKSRNSYADFGPYSYKEYYKLRVELFLSRYEKESWTSWNYQDWKAYNYYKNQESNEKK
jgi:hypothetical protein